MPKTSRLKDITTLCIACDHCIPWCNISHRHGFKNLLFLQPRCHMFWTYSQDCFANRNGASTLLFYLNLSLVNLQEHFHCTLKILAICLKSSPMTAMVGKIYPLQAASSTLKNMLLASTPSTLIVMKRSRSMLHFSTSKSYQPTSMFCMPCHHCIP